MATPSSKVREGAGNGHRSYILCCNNGREDDSKERRSYNDPIEEMASVSSREVSMATIGAAGLRSEQLDLCEQKSDDQMIPSARASIVQPMSSSSVEVEESEYRVPEVLTKSPPPCQQNEGS